MSVNTYTTLVEALQSLQERGFTLNFEFIETALQDKDSGEHFDPEDLALVEHHRFEGESSADDMAIVYALESADGRRGLLVDAFGTYANTALGDFLQRVRSAENV